MAITTYLCARAHGKRFTALPIFMVRAFHHGAIMVNTKAGIESPKDLEGRKVGVNRGYTVTTGLWARSVLQQEYGVDLSKITWVLSGDEHVAEYRPPANVVPIEKGKEDGGHAGSGGELVAAIGVEVDHPDVKPLIPNAKEAGLRGAEKPRPLSDQPHDRGQGRLAGRAPRSRAAIFSTPSSSPSASTSSASRPGRSRSRLRTTKCTGG